MNKELIEKMEQYSVAAERVSNLVDLAAHMMGKINCDCVSDNEEVRNSYPGWLESLLDTVSELAHKQNAEMDDILTGIEVNRVDKC